MNIAQMRLDELPEPEAKERELSERLRETIRSEIEIHHGSLGFDRYMELALYAPGLGYYRSPLARFGRHGDFVTAPELSPLFALCLARQLEQILSRLGGGDVFEAGAGSGKLCADLLNTLAGLRALPDRYLILETSAALRRHQRQTIERQAPEHISRVVWLDDLPPAGFAGVILANELLDAIPARRFRKCDGRVLEAFVIDREDRFDWSYAEPGDDELVAAVAAIETELGQPFAEGFISELGRAREAWLATAAERIQRGAVLLLDYGYLLAEYYHPQRRDGTLSCYFRHRTHSDPFLWPGLQDISVHVEFSGLCRAAVSAGLEVSGLTSQAEFLIATGLLEACATHPPGSPEHVRLTGQIRRLTLPGEMGELIKVLALTRGLDGPLLGFSGRDRRERL